MTMIGDLVRVVAKDGSVWWTQPEFAASHAAIERAILPASDEAVQASKRYWEMLIPKK